MDEFWIDGFGISNYRSFGPEPQLIGPCGKMNLIVGQNNSGKSNVLRFLSEHYSGLIDSLNGNSSYTGFSDLDLPVGLEVGQRRVFLGLRMDEGTIERHCTIKRGEVTKHVNTDNVKRLLSLPPFSSERGVAWFRYVLGSGRANLVEDDLLASLQRYSREFPEHVWITLHQQIFDSRGRGDFQEVQSKVLRAIGPTRKPKPAVSEIPAIREVVQSAGNERHPSGRGLIEQLAELQHPSGWQDDHLKDTFRQIERFLKTVTGNREASIEIPNDRKSLFVNINGKRLPLEALGTGVHEVIIIAAHATVTHREIICIEEPEIHLHPTLQRKLIQYLQSNTDNQYFIATHSAHLLDSPDASVFHVRWEDGHSVVVQVGTPDDRSSVCFDLGYRPSDLVQANCVIWVEGPSDRIYLNHWIKAIDSSLVEGTHYSIMFYGGRLLSHLSSEDEVEEFISLRRLNRRMVVVMDSDKASSRKRIGSTKRRICDELAQDDGFAWLTKGREIENYLPEEWTREAVLETHGKTVIEYEDADYGKRLQYRTARGEEKTADKVRVARWIVAKKEPNLVDTLGLKQMAERTVEFIRISNESSSTPSA